ncbi:MAG: GTP-binding protein [Deltaproteobacteria bacterium]|uniref:GTP-binding protein n=1 Tax=Candidatus Zymogenus saltonus TaxID=2844893 RepID=A0A9D8PMS4_9DELT|nr:GTP-binding protein [Candidatus Zymogenus saltonus]
MVKGDDKKRAGVVLIVGFLGAGKTTLLRHLLSCERDMSDTVVIVNEFGEVGIDGSLLEGVGEVVELTSGCICCTLALGIRKTLRDVIDNFSPKWIFIEASGVADPKNIIPIVGEFIDGGDVDSLKIVTVVEADLWSARDILGALFFNQLKSADLVVLNKVDLIDEDRLEKAVKEIREASGGSPVVPAVRARVDLEVIKEGVKGGKGLTQHKGYEEGTKAQDFISFSFVESRPLNESRLEKLLNSLPFGMFRIKGAVSFSDRTAFLSYVGWKMELTEIELTDITSSTHGDEKITRLAFVGWGVDKDEIIGRFKACLD